MDDAEFPFTTTRQVTEMSDQNFYRIALLAMLTSLAPMTLHVYGQQGLASYLRPEHREIVQRWLSSRSHLRLATEADCTNKYGLAATRKEEGRDYHPYYAVGDFNGDGKEDFAVVFVKTRKSKWPSTVAIFNGPLAGNSVPAFTTDYEDLNSGGLFYKAKVKPREGRLAIGVFESDDCVIFLPRGKTYVIKDCLGD
jgi:hypothetical protein